MIADSRRPTSSRNLPPLGSRREIATTATDGAIMMTGITTTTGITTSSPAQDRGWQPDGAVAPRP
jgi:hypothetical protein